MKCIRKYVKSERIVMEFARLARKRKMCRSFAPDPLSEEDVSFVIQSALRGPSAGFSQGVELVVVRSEEARKLFWSIVTTEGWLERTRSHKGLDNAQAIVIVTVDKHRYLKRYSAPDKSYSNWTKEEDWPAPFWYVDAGASVMLALLAATDRSLGALFFAIDRNHEPLRSAFLISSQRLIVGAIALGIPDGVQAGGSSRTIRRRDYSETVKVF